MEWDEHGQPVYDWTVPCVCGHLGGAHYRDGDDEYCVACDDNECGSYRPVSEGEARPWRDVGMKP